MPQVEHNHLALREVPANTAEALTKYKELNDRQRTFVLAYLKTGSVAEASKEANYSNKYGWSLLNRPDINSFIKENHKYWTSEEIAGVEEVMIHLSDIIRGEATDEIINAKTGKKELVKAPTLARLKAIEHMMKAYGMNTTNINLNGSISHEDSPRREVITVDELKDLIELSAEDIEILEEAEEGAE